MHAKVGMIVIQPLIQGIHGHSAKYLNNWCLHGHPVKYGNSNNGDKLIFHSCQYVLSWLSPSIPVLQQTKEKYPLGTESYPKRLAVSKAEARVAPQANWNPSAK